MRKQPLHFLPYNLCRFASAIFLAIALDNTVVAQQGPPVGPPPVKDPKSETRDRQNREATLRSAELGVAVKEVDKKQQEAAIEQMKQDFRRIQIVRNEIARSILANKPFDYKAISEETDEVNKRAIRLKAYLMSTNPDDKENRQKKLTEFNDQEMKDELVKLCKLIDSFVENPALKNPDITNVEQASKVGSDLLSLIELSGTLKRSADKLIKTSK